MATTDTVISIKSQIIEALTASFQLSQKIIFYHYDDRETFLLNVTEKPVFIELFLYNVTHKGNANFCWFSFMMTTRCRWGQQKRRQAQEKLPKKVGIPYFSF